MKKFMLGEDTLLDSDSAEYFWIRWMVGERYSVNKVCDAITRAFGGDKETSIAMLNVSLGKQTKYSLVELVKSKQSPVHI
ncbi:hypothetical protein JZN57_002670 [Vibrio alginolyticus]|uniref:hypothetical protein n=1 Tax=Vibrio TaxID=662 RepID=UPI001372C255|nr:hypothetical protein [Vibrio alginolyticus]EHD0129792.1 hypothetical protein [Vibrio alginolyticus]MCY9815769.1 hypothetical protein [Vibrio alginolyticus]NAW54665.1 hypothetical protein [Vibrio sp. V41_P2S12T139]NAW94719.1 hypothetical protein [Vibrio sp. V42_P2S4T144]